MMHSISSREAIKIIKANGWYEDSIRGSHHHFKHPVKTGKVTIVHPMKDIPKGTFKSILHQAGLDEKKV